MQKLIITSLILAMMFSTYNSKIVDIYSRINQSKSIYASYNGALKVKDGKLKNQYNEDIQLKGISSHGVQWFSDYMNYENMSYLKENWNINAIRIAMYTAENGYIDNKEDIMNKVIQIADNAILLDLYVIIDWHTLSDNDPNIYKEDSITFFDTISNKYRDVPNIIYEICNEPHGDDISWNNHVKPYAEEIIPVIRNNNPKSVIIVGTPNWCRDLDRVVGNELNFSNIMYSCHFYSGSHYEEIKNKLQIALDNNLPIFVSEWGTTNASGDGNVYETESRELINLLNQNNISWINWSFCNKNEGSAILSSDYILNSGMNIDDYLSQSGVLVRDLLK